MRDVVAFDVLELHLQDARLGPFTSLAEFHIADRGYVIVHGQIAFEGRSAEELNNNDLIKKFYLGL